MAEQTQSSPAIRIYWRCVRGVELRFCPRPAILARKEFRFRSIVVEAEWGSGVESFLPRALESDDILIVHVGRYSLQDRETEVPVVAVTQEAVSAVSSNCIVLPTPIQIRITD